MGTTRMSLNNNDGVVDKNCKFRNIKFIHIGNSVLELPESSKSWTYKYGIVYKTWRIYK